MCSSDLKSAEQVIGSRIRARVVKNKVAPPFKEAEFDILHEEGLSQTNCILDTAVEKGVIQKSGTWLNFENEKLGQGRDAARIFLKENHKILNTIEKRILENISGPATAEQKKK